MNVVLVLMIALPIVGALVAALLPRSQEAAANKKPAKKYLP